MCEHCELSFSSTVCCEMETPVNLEKWRATPPKYGNPHVGCLGVMGSEETLPNKVCVVVNVFEPVNLTQALLRFATFVDIRSHSNPQISKITLFPGVNKLL